MKLTLKKSKALGCRFLGFNQNVLVDDVSSAFKLLEVLVRLNTFQQLDSKFYFELINYNLDLELKGPFVKVLGRKINLPDNLLIIDIREQDYYEVALSENCNEWHNLNQYLPQINAIRNKIGDSLMFLSIDFNKIELHIFKK